MGMRITCRESTPALKVEMWLRADAAPIRMHVHPHQEERVTVVSGSLRFRTGNRERVLGPGDEVVSPPGEAHTIAPAGDGEVEVLAELSPALGYGKFLERSFALDRPGHVNRRGRANPFRLTTAKPQNAEFFVAGVPLITSSTTVVALQGQTTTPTAIASSSWRWAANLVAAPTRR